MGRAAGDFHHPICRLVENTQKPRDHFGNRFFTMEHRANPRPDRAVIPQHARRCGRETARDDSAYRRCYVSAQGTKSGECLRV
ncbi:MAG: hypothetical protein PHI18_05800 [bacterium]|nr:hypothetical protein [bacterium]